MARPMRVKSVADRSFVLVAGGGAFVRIRRVKVSGLGPDAQQPPARIVCRGLSLGVGNRWEGGNRKSSHIMRAGRGRSESFWRNLIESVVCWINLS